MLPSKSGPWARLVGEFVVIVVGVLAALAVDSWQEDRRDADLGEVYLHGLLGDLVEDSANLALIGFALERKQASLDVLLEVAWGRLELPPDSVARLLYPSAALGWRVPVTGAATYEELKSSGTLRLVGDPGLRSELVRYYEDWQHQMERLDRQRSTYPNAIYGLAPESALLRGEPLGREATDVIARLSTRAMRDQLNHETNYASLVAQRHQISEERLRSLLAKVRQEIS